MPRHVFTYGSLMFPQVWQRVVQGNYNSAAATVSGFARYEILGQTYPAMLPQPGAEVSGVVYFDVAAPDIAILDAFESTEYQRQTVLAKVGPNLNQAVEAYIYLEHDKVTSQSWQPERFQLQYFIDAYVPFGK